MTTAGLKEDQVRSWPGSGHGCKKNSFQFSAQDAWLTVFNIFL